MTDRLFFVIPGPPIPCARARVYADKNTGRVRSVTPENTRAYESHVRVVSQIAVNRAAWKPAEDAAYSVEFRVFRDVRRGDWDNFAKALGDGMNGVVWKDDRQITDAVVRVRFDKMRPRVEVVVERMPTEAAVRSEAARAAVSTSKAMAALDAFVGKAKGDSNG